MFLIIAVSLFFAFLMGRIFMTHFVASPVETLEPMVNQSQRPMNVENLELVFESFIDEHMFLTTGIGAWVEEDYYARTGRFDLDNLNDRIHINMFAGDAHLETQTLLLKVFVDFEAVPFKVAGMDDYVLTFVFETSTQHRISIPIYLYSGLIDTGYNRNFTVLSAVYPQYYMHQELMSDRFTIEVVE